MKLLMAPIEMIAKFSEKGIPRPMKFRVESDLGRHEIKVDSVLSQEEEKLAGNRMLVYRCQSVILGAEKLYELKYEVSTCKWYLSKL